MLLSFLFSRQLFNTAKEIKGSTLLLFSPEDIKYELEDLSIDDRIHPRNFLREIVSLWDVFKVGILSTLERPSQRPPGNIVCIPLVILLPFVAI